MTSNLPCFVIFRFQYDEDYLVDQSKTGAGSTDEYKGRGFISRSFNDPIAKRLNKFPKFSEYTRPHFKPTEQSTSSTVSSTMTPSSTSTGATTFSTRTSISMTSPTITTVTSAEEVNTQSSVTSPKSTNTTAEITDDTDSVISNATTTTTALPNVTVVQIVKEQNFSLNEIPGQNDRIDVDLEESAEVVVQPEETIERVTTFEFIETTVVPVESTIDEKAEEEEEGQNDNDDDDDELDELAKTTEQEIIAAESQEQQQFRPRPTSSDVSTGFYQEDFIKKKDPVLKVRGA